MSSFAVVEAQMLVIAFKLSVVFKYPVSHANEMAIRHLLHQGSEMEVYK